MGFLEDLTLEEKEKILGKKPTKSLYYSFSEFPYKTTSKERVLSGITELDYLLKGFEMGGVTIWTGKSNARENNSNDNHNKDGTTTERKDIFL